MWLIITSRRMVAPNQNAEIESGHDHVGGKCAAAWVGARTA